MLEASLKQSPGMPKSAVSRPAGAPWAGRNQPSPFTIRISPAIKNAALDLVLTAQRRHTPSIYDPLRYRNAELHLENTGCGSEPPFAAVVPVS